MITDVKNRLLKQDGSLNNVGHSLKNQAVELNSVTESVLQNPKIFKQAIDIFMAGSCNCLHVLVIIVETSWHLTASVGTAADAICQKFFTRIQLFTDSVVGNV